ncbi:hypothetical protein NQ314_014977 [Rhamnusium bicolor]|uniref:receptor protein-tyrosine kinase n=1 Tax=Rhamnusium bicolor TaxID=1586634 RepID=A0AAV8X0Z4_9CUCU|nr:hypothetical protein NQ314_014977 [Rhamnusium bicolor]
MGIYILYVVFEICICIVFKAHAIAPNETEYNEEELINNIFENITAIADSTLILQCPKKSNETEWKLLNDNNTNGKTLQTNSNVLEFRPVSPADKGIYACFTNKTWIVKKYNVTVLERPHFIKKMQKLILKPAGNTVRLNCKAGGIPPPNITWYREDKSPPKRELGDIKTNHWSLTLEDSVLSDKGNYTCVVCNIVGCINFTFVVEVVERYHNTPILTNGLENSTVSVGSNVTLKCESVSDLHPYITWTRFYNDPNNSELLQKSDSGNVGPEVYQLINVTHEDEGWYACFISNSLGTTSSSAYLQVVDEPTIFKEEPPNFFTIGIVAAIGAVVVISVITFMCIHFRQKIKREKREKMIAVETARAAIKTTQWTKKSYY